MSGALDILEGEARKALKKRSQPDWTAPMLATLTDDYFSDPGWIYERKLDGERCLAFRDGSSLRLRSRNKKELNDTYPELADALRDQDATDFIVDGEIVAFKGDVTSFERLQGRMQVTSAEEARSSGVAVYFYLFDMLHLDGHDLTKVPLRDRKRLLRRAIGFSSRVRFCAHRNEEGEKYHEEACRKHWEGVIAKDASSAYVHSRSKSWLKFKCVNRQELVIGGFTDPEGSRVGFGALIVGFYDNGDLVCAGKVGTGYDDDTLERLRKRMDRLERKTPPFDRGETPTKGVHWVRPELVGEFGFTEWTRDDRLRHPRFLGLRRDKEPEDVVKETPA